MQYGIVYIFNIRQAIKAGNLFFFTATNPCCELGGLFPTSKKEILDQLPRRYVPQDVLITIDDTHQTAWEKVQKAQIDFPLIIKPNE
jgi:hypothetical protein